MVAGVQRGLSCGKQQIILKWLLNIPVLKSSCPLLRGENLKVHLLHGLQAPLHDAPPHTQACALWHPPPPGPPAHPHPSPGGSRRFSYMRTMSSLRCFLVPNSESSTPVLFRSGLNCFLGFGGGILLVFPLFNNQSVWFVLFLSFLLHLAQVAAINNLLWLTYTMHFALLHVLTNPDKVKKKYEATNCLHFKLIL